MVSRRDYNAEMVAAARSVLIEVSNLLGAFRDQIVVVGGWVPELLLPGGHVGSTDVDLALDHRHLDEGSYRTTRIGHCASAKPSSWCTRSWSSWASAVARRRLPHRGERPPSATPFGTPASQSSRLAGEYQAKLRPWTTSCGP